MCVYARVYIYIYSACLSGFAHTHAHTQKAPRTASEPDRTGRWSNA